MRPLAGSNHALDAGITQDEGDMTGLRRIDRHVHPARAQRPEHGDEGRDRPAGHTRHGLQDSGRRAGAARLRHRPPSPRSR